MPRLLAPDAAHFPYNVILALEESLQELIPHTDPAKRDGLRIYKRPLNDGDDSESVGIFPVMWSPDNDSMEMRGRPVSEPTFQRYPIQVVSLITSADELEGILAHSQLAALIKQSLYRSETLEVSLRTMQAYLNGSIERVIRWGVESQTYLSDESGSMFSFMAETMFFVDTEIK